MSNKEYSKEEYMEWINVFLKQIEDVKKMKRIYNYVHRLFLKE